MKTARIAVIIPFFNRRSTVIETLESVAAQTLSPARIVLVDDGSTDDGAQLVSEWIAKLRGRLDCHLERQANVGAGAARNRGLQLTGSVDYIAFLDSDDVWPADFLARTHAALSANSRAVAATCNRKFVYADGRRSKIQDCSGLAACAALWMLRRGAGVASMSLFRHRAVARLGGFDPVIATGEEDAALFMRVSLEGPWLHVPGEPVAFRRGLAERRGGEGNLTDKHADRYFHWARTYEDFFTGDGAPLTTSSRCKKGMARRWHEAGSQLYRHRAYGESLACFRKSQNWWPWRFSCYLWMLRAWLATYTRRAGGTANVAPNSTNQPNVPANYKLLSQRDSKRAMARR
jgi:glycosyltransferase involved in cell wall biosynthesis